LTSSTPVFGKLYQIKGQKGFFENRSIPLEIKNIPSLEAVTKVNRTAFMEVLISSYLLYPRYWRRCFRY